jgi:hypothetical protein
MDNPISLKSTEKKVYQTTISDGLWDILIGLFVLQFAIAPLLSSNLGDFWSSVIFLPVWILVYLAIKIIRKKIVTPRIGIVKFGKTRIRKLKFFSIVMLVINLIVLILGFLVFRNFNHLSGALINGIFGLIILAGFCLAGTLLEYPRLYLYGSILLIAPLIGEWLYIFHGASHHGYPIVFGISSGLMMIIGILSFFRLLNNHPKIEIPDES